MNELFVSYGREDREMARMLADGLVQEGYAADSIWWDPELLPGECFDEIINKRLAMAKCIIVLWSKASVRSHWVREEAREGLKRDTLVPALLDELDEDDIPLGFRSVHAAHLAGWRGERTNPEFKRLLASIGKHFLPPADTLAPVLTVGPSSQMHTSIQTPVLTVGPSGQMYTSIARAIRTAPSGARINVYPGEYNEPLVIDQVLDIVGVTPRSSEDPEKRITDSTPQGDTKIRIFASGPAITFNAAYGRIANLVVQPHPESPSHAVVIVGGRLHITDCDISRSQFACVLVQRDAHLEIARSCIYRSAQGGLLFSDESTGNVNNCLVYANAHSGIHVMGKSIPIITENVIRGNGAFGVFVYQSARPVIKYNMISRNGRGGLLVSDEAHPVVIRNRLKCNELQGILVSGRYAGPPRGTYLLNTIANNKGLGVLVEYQACPMFKRNVIIANESSGVRFQYGAGGLFAGNDITNNRDYGVSLGDGRPTFAGNNHISDNMEGDFEGDRRPA